MSDQRLKIAVFIDFDNVEIGVKTTLGRQFDIGAVLEAIKERGEIITKVAYGDWKRAGDHGRAMSQHAVRLVQRVMTPGGDKNGADINLALDALEMAFTHAHINAFVIVGGDSDFITLVEKLKQYDRKVFVVGGRAFTSQVMQKNCTEFIAYENVTGGAFPVTSERSDAKGAGPDRRAGRGGRDRGREHAPAAAAALDQALPLVKRALKVLADREVSPQLGLLKSTLLQLDSSFSERDYGVSTFRDFAEKLEKQGLVTLKHSGRTTVVELADDADRATGDGDESGTSVPVLSDRAPVNPAPPEPLDSRGELQAPIASPRHGYGDGDADADETATYTSGGNVADGVALIRAILAEATTPPRWPMYVRQMKQFIRNARPDFDEKRYGSILDLMRACQKDGLLRLDRDRQGGLRVFASGTVKPPAQRPGWSTIAGPETDSSESAESADSAREEAPAPPPPALPPPADEEPEDTRGNVPQAAEGKPRRARKATGATKSEELRTKSQEPRTRIAEAAPAEKPKRARKTAVKSDEAKPKARTPSRRSRP